MDTFDDFDRLTEARFTPEEIAAADASIHDAAGTLEYTSVQRDLLIEALETLRDSARDDGYMDDITEIEILIGRL